MYHIAICDDESASLNAMHQLIDRYVKEHRIVAKCSLYTNEVLLLEDIGNGFQYDVYFLDIEMKEIQGTDLARKIKEISKEAIIIFITFHMQYVLESFELEIFRYIPKDCLKEMLPKALQAVFGKLELQTDRFFYISNAKRTQKIALKEIIYIYKNNKNSVFVLREGEIKVREPLCEVYKNLSEEDFIQTDRCYIVNLRYIYKVDTVRHKIFLHHQIALDIPKNRIQEIKNTLVLFWGNQI